MMCGVLESALGGLGFDGVDLSRRASLGDMSLVAIWFTDSVRKKMFMSGGRVVPVG